MGVTATGTTSAGASVIVIATPAAAGTTMASVGRFLAGFFIAVRRSARTRLPLDVMLHDRQMGRIRGGECDKKQEDEIARVKIKVPDGGKMNTPNCQSEGK